jgi:hemolysin activation/secretion protein
MKPSLRPALGLLPAVLLLLLARAAVAQGAPPVKTPSELPTPSQMLPRAPSTAPLPDWPSVPRALPAQRPDEVDLRLDVSAFAVDDDAPASLRAALPALTAAQVGPGRLWSDLMAAVDAVTQHLQRREGLYLAQAYLPEQSADDGLVRIGVLLGRLERVEVVEATPVRMPRQRIDEALAVLRRGEPLYTADVERALLLLNELPGLQARFDFAPGANTGTTRLTVTLAPTTPWRVRGDVDNHGPRTLGRLRAGATLLLDSPLGFGETFALNGLGSQGGALRFVAAGASLPLSAATRLSLQGTALRYQVDEDAVPLGLQGRASTLSAALSHALVRSRGANLTLRASLERQRDTDEQTLQSRRTVKRSDALALGAAGDWRGGATGATTLGGDLAFSGGHLRYLEGERPAEDDAGWRRLNATASLRQGLWRQWEFAASTRAQWGFSNLDSTQQFRLGGPDGVRAFAPGEASGDSGVVASAELRHTRPLTVAGRSSELGAAVFVDTGHVRPRHDPSRSSGGDTRSFSLSAAGLAVSWTDPAPLQLRASLAWPLHGQPRSEPPRRPRLYLQFTALF